MVIGFKKQFVEPILQGTKVHTIREDKHNRWHDNMLMHQATGVRSKEYNCFNKAVCISTQTIEIKWKQKGKRSWVCVKIDGKKIHGVLHRLSPNDGFAAIGDFLNYFDKDFTGKIIHWTNLRY